MFNTRRIIPLFLSLSTFTADCFTMEEDPNQKELPDLSALFGQWEATDKLAKALQEYQRVSPTLTSEAKKRDSRDQILKALTEGLLHFHNEINSFTTDIWYAKVRILLEHGLSYLKNPKSINPHSTQDDALASLTKAHKLFQETFHIFERLEPIDPKNKQQHTTCLMLLPYSGIFRTDTLLEQNIKAEDEILAVCEEAVNCLDKLLRVSPDMVKSNLYEMIFTSTLKFSMKIFGDISSEYDALCQTDQKTKNLAQRFQEIANRSKRVAKLLRRQIIETTHPRKKQQTTMKNSSKAKAKVHKDIIPAELNTRLLAIRDSLPPLLDVDSLFQFPQSIYCGALRGASLACLAQDVTILPEVLQAQLKQKYVEKSDEYLSEAFTACRGFLYHNEYKGNPAREKEYLTALLDDLLGIHEPLKEFYQIIRREREEAAAQRHAEYMQRERQKRLEDKERSDFNASYEPFETQISNKIPRNPLFEKENSAYIAPEVPEVIVTEPAVQPKIIKRDPIAIPFEDFYVFCQLTRSKLEGKKPDDNIKQGEVLKLLQKLGCEIKSASGGGSHRKATDPLTGAEWTIPPAWDGPIQPPYRVQLNTFLQDLMGINPDDVVEKKDHERTKAKYQGLKDLQNNNNDE